MTASMQDIEHLSTNRLSVVVPVFNEENAVSGCIERLLTESEIDEILIVDNNSTDGTASIIQEFAEKYDKVRYVFEPAKRRTRPERGLRRLDRQHHRSYRRGHTVQPGWQMRSRVSSNAAPLIQRLPDSPTSSNRRLLESTATHWTGR